MTGTPRVLVVEDNEDMRLAVATELRAQGFAVVEAGDLAEADAALDDAERDCVVFDRMLPDGDALTFVGERRQSGWAVPVLFLTARDAIADRVAGFRHGGDDYLVKPFAMSELAARVAALCRRPGEQRTPVLRHADLEVDTARREVQRDGTLLTLSDKEFAILEHLMARSDRAVTRSELIEHCWDSSTDPMSNVVDVVVRRLRTKLGEPELIHTVRGVGYRFGDSRGES